jgi:hypothetical protein
MSQFTDVLEMETDLRTYQKFVTEVREEMNRLLTLEMCDEAYNIAQTVMEKTNSL